MDIELRFVVEVEDSTHAQDLFDELHAQIETMVWAAGWTAIEQHAND